MLSKRFLPTLLTFFLAACCIALQVRAEPQPALTVGALLSLSGGLEQWCLPMRQGMELAASEAERLNVKLIFEDDHSTDKKASVAAAHKLLDTERVDALLSWTLSTVPVLVPIAKKARTPLIVGAYDKRLERGGDYAFGAIVNNQLVPVQIARFFKARGAQRAALVLAADDWSSSFDAPFREESKRLGIDVVYSETINPQESETRSIVSNLKKNRVDAVLAPLYANALLSFIRRHREMRSSSIISVGDGMFEEDIKALGVAAEGVTATQIWLESPELTEKISKRFATKPNSLQLGLVASGYDMMKHIIHAARELYARGLAITGESLNQELQSVKSTGYLGEHMLGAAPAQSGEQTVEVKNGSYRLIE